jgi:hypothetical protein
MRFVLRYQLICRLIVVSSLNCWQSPFFFMTKGARYRWLNIPEFSEIAEKHLRNFTIFGLNISCANIAECANIAKFANIADFFYFYLKLLFERHE